MRHNRRYYAVWVVVTLGYVAGFVAVPMLVGWCVGAVAHGLPAAEVVRRVAWLAAATTARAVLRYFSRTLVFNAARQIEYELRDDIFANLQRLPQSFYFRWRTGDIMSRCVNDLSAVRLLMGVGLLNLLQTPVLYAAVIGAMMTVNARLALLVLLPYPLFILIARTFGRSIHHWSLLTQEGLAEASNQLQETISGIAVVKAYAMEGVTARRFEAANQELYRRELGLVRAQRGDARDHGHAARARDGLDPAGRRPGHRVGAHGGVRLLHVRDVRLRADLPDLHHGLGGGARAARRGVDAADRRAALRAADDRGSARCGAAAEAARRARVPPSDVLVRERSRARARAARHRAARARRQHARRGRHRGRRQDHARLADSARSTRCRTGSSSSTAST